MMRTVSTHSAVGKATTRSARSHHGTGRERRFYAAPGDSRSLASWRILKDDALGMTDFLNAVRSSGEKSWVVDPHPAQWVEAGDRRYRTYPPQARQ
jgi:hypothetical protein